MKLDGLFFLTMLVVSWLDSVNAYVRMTAAVVAVITGIFLAIKYYREGKILHIELEKKKLELQRMKEETV